MLLQRVQSIFIFVYALKIFTSRKLVIYTHHFQIVMSTCQNKSQRHNVNNETLANISEADSTGDW